MKKDNLFNNENRKKVIAMLHLQPLPDSPQYENDITKIRELALKDFKYIEESGVDSFIIENFGDIPFNKNISDLAFSTMTSISTQIASKTKLPFGINIQFNDFKKEWALSTTINANFIRVEAFVETRVGVFGVCYPAAPELLRLNTKYNNEINIFADINSKETVAFVEEPLEFNINNAIKFGAKAIIVTGENTGSAPELDMVRKVKNIADKTPVFVGSGISELNAFEFLEECDGIIVGTSIKNLDCPYTPVDLGKLKRIVEIARKFNEIEEA